MKFIKLLALFLGLGIFVQAQKTDNTEDCCKKMASKKSSNAFVCKLTTAEFRERKATVIASLKEKVLEKKEMKNGFAYKFTGGDAMVDEISNFIKTERQCCGFFRFDLTINGDSELWLAITGPKGAKQVIVDELGM